MKLNNNGTSLLELIIGLLIGSMVIFGAYQMYTYISRSASRETKKAELQSKMVAVSEMISRDLRMSGFGLPGNGFRPALNSAGNDVLQLYINDLQLRTVLGRDVVPGDSIIYVASASQAKPLMYVCLVQNDTVYRKITRVRLSTNGRDTLTLDSLAGKNFAAATAQVFFASGISYQVVASPAAGLCRTLNGATSMFMQAIDTIRVSPRDSAGTGLTGQFEKTKMVSMQFGGRISTRGAKDYVMIDSTMVDLRN
jgi:hypothetical protein